MPKKSFGKKLSSNRATIPDELLLRMANEFENPLLKFDDDDVYDQDRQCLSTTITGIPISIKYFLWTKIPNELQEWMINLTEINMKDLYDSCSWKWNRQSKINEFKHSTAKHLIVFDLSPSPSSSEEEKPIAFVHFRFEKGYVSDAVLYCYELQIEKSYQQKGIGSYLMNLLESLGKQFRMKKSIVTVLKNNQQAYQFYTNGLQFRIDKNSPSNFDEQQQPIEYEILSKKIS
uniref:N-alpha-acetyltransferase 40 n=1 Tax=Dermatophagoides pteronyssinus TaxID=6956 RepID=A0A6P6Y3K1_DERPT|nr:N-alpha-acetyltransferase 40-like [Dermatophagoides pteronyssinus]